MFDAVKNKKVKIYSIGSCNHLTRAGSYEVILEYKEKFFYMSADIENTTANRCIIQGLIDAVERLKEPCDVEMITSTSIGVKLASKGKGPNFDKISELFRAIMEKQCTVDFVEWLGEGDKLNSLIALNRNKNYPRRFLSDSLPEREQENKKESYDDDYRRVILAILDDINPLTGESLEESELCCDPIIKKALRRLLGEVDKNNRKLSEEFSRAGKSWKQEEDEKLTAEFDSGLSIEEIADKHKRTKIAISARLVRLGKIDERAEIYKRE